MPITFHKCDVKFTLRQRRGLSGYIEKQIKNHRRRGTSGGLQKIDLCYIFCSDDYLLDLNRKFLNHNYYTDILTFPILQTQQSLEAEIYISIDRVNENALLLMDKSSSATANQEAELHRVIFHGVLHLLGYKDKTKSQLALMRKMEKEWMRKFEDQKPKKRVKGRI